MRHKSTLWYKLAALILVLALVVPVLAACGDDDDETATPAATTPAATTPVKTTPVAPTAMARSAQGKPIKIGVIQDWSGIGASAGWLASGAAQVLEYVVNEKQGGILGGRPVEFVKYDMNGTVAGANSAAIKATLDKVSAVVQGGFLVAHAYAIADVTAKAKVPFLDFFGSEDLYGNHYKYTANTFVDTPSRIKETAKVIINLIKPTTVAFFAVESDDARGYLNGVKPLLQAAGIKFVSEDFVIGGTQDFSSYLTRLKHTDPDIILSFFHTEDWVKICSQMMELGGWGSIKVLSMASESSGKTVTALPGAQGMYTVSEYLPDSPGGQAFRQVWAELAGKSSSFKSTYGGAEPDVNFTPAYTSDLAAVKLIELAGTDNPQALADWVRSGKLEFDSPLGVVKIGTDGTSNVSGRYFVVKDGQLSPIEY